MSPRLLTKALREAREKLDEAQEAVRTRKDERDRRVAALPIAEKVGLVIVATGTRDLVPTPQQH